MPLTPDQQELIRKAGGAYLTENRLISIPTDNGDALHRISDTSAEADIVMETIQAWAKDKITVNTALAILGLD